MILFLQTWLNVQILYLQRYYWLFVIPRNEEATIKATRSDLEHYNNDVAVPGSNYIAK